MNKKIIYLSTVNPSLDVDLVYRQTGDVDCNYNCTTINPNSYSNLTVLLQHFIDLIGYDGLIIVFDDSSKTHKSYINSTYPYLTTYTI